ncbi:formate dehydrogenase accessory sulfurtransferase FdhD [Eubacterium barkeri]|uniref:FdhD protein n=1 Tax=Eubacterium barkeri TaxID=1528 RepID=A0A1H3FTF1_EUBBA|nr:formate dehydrogenase accessory sulfurtransferase FdhD [Eubacterium barkeri]SDX94087.1 FdhD protein [Eubacterium barkeri]
MTIYREEIEKITPRGILRMEDPMVREYPVALTLNGQGIITLMTLPRDLEELALGFLSLKGLIPGMSAVTDLTITPFPDSPGATIAVTATTTGSHQGNFFSLSEESIASPHKKRGHCPLTTSFEAAMDRAHMDADALFQMMEAFSRKSEVFVQTGGVHSIGLYKDGQPLLFYDDVSRYNTYNKLFGGILRHGLSTPGTMLLTTGRIPSEVMGWIIARGIPWVLSISAPTQGSVQLAREHGVTLMGFVRGDRLNFYA